MSAFLPAPLTIVVFSLSIITFLARPSMLSVTFSSLMPRSSEIAWPPVRTAMSWSIALRRSPKPGAFTAATLRPPRSCLTPLQLDAHFVGVCDKLRRDVAAVELHALDNIELGLKRLCLLDRDDALVTDLLHRPGKDAAN